MISQSNLPGIIQPGPAYKVARDPLSRHIKRFCSHLALKRRLQSPGFIPSHEYAAHLQIARAINKTHRTQAERENALASLTLRWNQIKISYRKPTPPKIIRPQPRPKLSEEQKRRNLLIFQANIQRQQHKHQASKEWNTLVNTWKTKWWPILGRSSARSKAKKHRRLIHIRNSKLTGDIALTRQLEIIRYGPCICFWCNAKLHSGGEADHIVPLSKGGSHTSSNICASCPPCNSLKNNKLPSDPSLHHIPFLL